MNSIKYLTLAALVLSALNAAELPKSAPPAEASIRHLTAKEVFDDRQPVMFQDNFQSGQFGKWKFSENDDYEIIHENSERIKIVDAPGLGSGCHNFSASIA